MSQKELYIVEDKKSVSEGIGIIDNLNKKDSERKTDRGQKVWILFTSAGAGHKAATNSLKIAWTQLYPDDEVVTVDILDYTPAIFRFIYSRGYLLMASKLPILWRIAFYRGEDLHKFNPPGKLSWFFRKLIMGKFIRSLKKKKPDIIVSTHFMPSDAVYLLNREMNPPAKFAIIVTDYGIHTAWLTANADRFYVPTEAIKSELLTLKDYLNIDSDNIKVTGIPIHPKYIEIDDKNALRRKYNLEPDIFTILLFRDVFTKGNFEYFVKYLSMVPHPIQLIMLAGKEWPISDRIKRKFAENNISYRIFGYIDFMEELMALADIVITKSGGLTTSECLAAGTPIAIYKPYAGQEERNAEYLMEKSAGIKLNQLAGLPYTITELIENPEKLKNLSHGAKSISRPNAAFDIVNDLKKIGEGSGDKD
jgi:processive 1,2-diacylglycerol beta-glucosyltransferase